MREMISLRGLPDECLFEMAQVLEYRVLERMALTFSQGGETDAMAIIISGR